jgi:hypothetical protein
MQRAKCKKLNAKITEKPLLDMKGLGVIKDSLSSSR